MEEDKKYKIIIGFLSVLLVIVILGGFYFFINQNNFNKEDYLENFFSPEINNLTEDQIERKTEEKENGIIGENETREEEAKKEVVQASQSLVEKKDGVLILRLDNGKNHIIPDVVGEDDEYPVPGVDSYNNSGLSRFYSYDKLHEDINYYGILVSYNAGNALGNYYLLVNKANGNHVTLVSSNLVKSPDKNRIVSYNQDVSGFSTNGFTVLSRKESGNFKIEAQVEVRGWGPFGAKWISNKEIEFQKFDFVQDRVIGSVNYVLEETSYGYNNWVEK